MLNRNLVSISLILVAGSGCGAANETDSSIDDTALLQCGSTPIQNPDGTTFDRPILYSRYEIEDEIARRRLGGQLGFQNVETCEQAARAAKALYSDDGNFERSSATGQRAEAEEKIYRAVGLSVVNGTLEVRVDGGWCTGTLLNAGTAITAAHCVQHVAGLGPSNPNDARAPIVWTRLNLWRPQTGRWHCLTGGPTYADGKCVDDGLATIWQFGPYTGSGNWDSDVAVIMVTDGNREAPNPVWPGLTESDFMRVYTGSFNNFSSYSINGSGYGHPNGTGDGVMRYSGFGNDWFGDYAYYSETRTPRTCHGDSGGPATIFNRDLTTNITYANVIGHHVGRSDGEGWGECGGDDEKQYGMRLHTGTPGGSKIDWIQSKMWLERQETCYTRSGSVGNYRKCFP